MNNAISSPSACLPPKLAALLRVLPTSSADSLSAWLALHSLDEATAGWLEMHRLAPFAFCRLRNAGLLACVPSPAQDLLRAAYYNSVGQYAALVEELRRLLTTFRSVGIDPVILKGMALGILVYPLPTARVVSDLDLLVERGQMPMVREALAVLGYRDMGLAPEHHLAFGNHLHARRELAAGWQVAVEIHWNLVHDLSYARHIDLAAVHTRTQEVDFGGFRARVLDPADQLIHAAAHLLQHSHNWNLLWLLDLRLLLDRYVAAWDWSELVTRAKKFHLAGALRYWLELADRIFGSCLPAEACHTLAEVEPDREDRRRLSVVFGRPPRVGQLLWLRARGAGGWWPRVTYLAETLFPPWPYMQERYRLAGRWQSKGHWLAMFYYGWRVMVALKTVFRRRK